MRAGKAWELEVQPAGATHMQPTPDLVLLDLETPRGDALMQEWQALAESTRMGFVRRTEGTEGERAVVLGADAVWSWDELERTDLRELFLEAQRARIRRLEAELAHLRPLRGLAAAGRLAETLGHPLANLMQTVLGRAQLARESVGGARPDLESVLTAAREAREILRQLSSLARVLEGSDRGLRLSHRALLLPLLDSIQRRGSHFSFRGQDLLDHVALEAGSLAWLLVELVALGQHHLPRGGSIEIAAERGTRAGAPQIVLVLRAQGQAATSASDAEAAQALLSMEELAAELGASVAVGARSSGSLQLELWLAAVPPAEGTAGARVLHVVQHDEVARHVGALLAGLGFAVTRAHGAAEALQVIERRRGSIDVVLVDEGSSELPGDVLAREVAALDPHLPIVLASAFPVVSEGEPDLRMHRVAKPYAARTLEAALRAALRAALAPRSANEASSEMERG